MTDFTTEPVAGYAHWRRTSTIITPFLKQLLEAVETDKRTERQICKRAGVHDKAISYLRNKHTYPRIDTIENIAQAMGYKLVLEKL